MLQVNLIIIRPTAQAIVSLTFGYYILKPVFPGCEPPETSVTLLAALCISKFIHDIIHITDALIYNFNFVNINQWV